MIGGSYRRLIGIARRALREDGGASALEFALLAPIFGLLFAGAADLGLIIATRLKLESNVSAASNYAVVNAAQVAAASATTLANSVAAIVSDEWADATVTVNAGPTRVLTPTTANSSGAAAQADSCYCPTVASGAVQWGSPAICASTCGGGGLAGKFVSIRATRSYSPLFAGYGIVASGQIMVRAVVQAQ